MDPQLAQAHQALKEGRKADAVGLLKSYLAGTDAPAPVHALLLNLLLESRHYAEGVTWSERAIRSSPRDYTLLNLHGAFLRLTDRKQEAIEIFDRAIRLRPGEVAARANMGHVYNDLANGASAEKIFALLVRQHPRISELQRALGVALLSQEKIDLAERRFRQALSLDPANIDAALDLSAAQVQRGDLPGALTTLDDTMLRNPKAPRVPRAKAAMLRHAGRREEAVHFLNSIAPHHNQAGWFHLEMARNLTQADPAKASAHHRRAVELEPRNTEFHLALAEHLLRQKSPTPGSNISDAYAVLSSTPPAAKKMSPSETRARAQILTRAIDWDGLHALGSFTELGRGWAEANLHVAFFDHLGRVTTPGDRRELIHQHRMWGDKAIARALRQPIVRPSGARQASKIRIGFLSSDLREHPVSYFAWPLLEHVDRERFELYCYSYFRAPEPSPLQRKIAEMVDVFRWHPEISDRDAAQMIANDDLDILFELGGSTHMNKLEVMAWKPARLCASWLGYPHSAGLSTIDYLLVDPFLSPPDPDLLVEKPLTMPHSWITMSEKAFPDGFSIDPVCPNRRNGYITFGTANNPYKYNLPMLRTWARVMKKVPHSRFIFVRPEVGAAVVVNNLKRAFAAEGISGDRIEFRPIDGGHMPHYNDIDITLDTFPQTGGTTTCEALWMGVPTVTLVGEALFERLSYSILQNVGLGDLCATSAEQFVDIAVALAADTDRLQSLRTGLREKIRTSPLGQTKQFARDFYDLVARTIAAETDKTPLPSSI